MINYRLSTSEIPGLPQLQVRSFISVCGRKYFTRLNVYANAVDDGPMCLATQNRIHLANASLCQIYFNRMLMERLCKSNSRNVCELHILYT